MKTWTEQLLIKLGLKGWMNKISNKLSSRNKNLLIVWKIILNNSQISLTA